MKNAKRTRRVRVGHYTFRPAVAARNIARTLLALLIKLMVATAILCVIGFDPHGCGMV